MFKDNFFYLVLDNDILEKMVNVFVLGIPLEYYM